MQLETDQTFTRKDKQDCNKSDSWLVIRLVRGYTKECIETNGTEGIEPIRYMIKAKGWLVTERSGEIWWVTALLLIFLKAHETYNNCVLYSIETLRKKMLRVTSPVDRTYLCNQISSSFPF